MITAAFPPPPTDRPPPAVATAGKGLSVVRWMPEGEVPLAPELSVTFSQPMIAVTSQEDAAKVQPVKLQPTPKGRWRWIGTRTIVFDPEVRFPQATTYTVTIPAGTKSATGEALAAAKSFTFETPAAKLVSSTPTSGPQQLDVPMFLLFDQNIDPKAVLAKLTVKANGGLRATRLLDDAEIEKSHELESLVAAAKADHQDGRWVALRTTDKLPGDAEVFVELGVGTPSAEGPNTTKFAQRFSFRTFPPLKLVEATCGWGGNEGCRPRTPLRLELNNPLDLDAFAPSQVTITPAIPDLKVHAAGTSITISGTKQPRTGYTVTLAGKIKDEFGQTLGGSEKRTFLVGDPETEFFGPSDMVVLDPMAPGRTLDFFTSSYRALKVRLYKVTPADYDSYVSYLSERWRKDKPATVPGRLVFDDLVQIKPGQELLTETHVDLSTALDPKGFGHVIAIIQPSPWTETTRPPELISWVQATHLGIDVHLDSDTMHAYASELDSGKPAGGVQLELRPAGVKATSDATGLAAFPLAPPSVGAHYLLARRDGDVAFVTESDHSYSSGSWDKRVFDERLQLQEHVLDDRTLYRPGEEVSIKGWMRWIDRGKGGDVGPLDGALTGLTFRVVDEQNNEIAKGTSTVTALGGFDAKFTLPKTPNLGRARIEFSPTGPRARPSDGFSHYIRVEEFRRPEFEVKAAASDGPFLIGGGGDVTVSAKYFTGAALPGAQVTWAVSASTTSFTPPNRDDYQFGAWHAWWSEGFDRDYGDDGGYDDDEAYLGGRYRTGANRGTSSWSLEGKTDAVGEHTLHLDFLSANPATPMSVTTAATVTDVNRQAWSAQTSLVVHPSSLYVGLKAKRPFVEKGNTAEVLIQTPFYPPRAC
ncbi:MAG: Ig-like domain-containing protein [Myxococcales bacterium]|nr:Ig-like domain-containing protein [Myxococcales bacterium]